MGDATGLTKLVPGFDFLQNLVKNAGAALPGIGQWVAPTLDPAELEKRIEELRTVQFWLEQNARMLAATIQALEVQRMTLSTLKTMNVQMGDLREALTIKPRASSAAPAAAPLPAAARAPASAGETFAVKPRGSQRKEPAAPAPKPGQAVDPMQWWGALTKQFAELATGAMKDTATDAAKALAGNMVKQSFDAAATAMKKVATAPARAAANAVQSATKDAGRRAPTKRRRAR